MTTDAIVVDDARDPRLTDYAGVRAPELLRERGLAIAEGRLVVRRLLQSRRVAFRSFLLNHAAWTALRDVLDEAAAGIPIYVASPQVIIGATGFDLHRGCLAVVERPASTPLAATLAASGFVVVLERVVDPDNVGSVFRNAEAFGADAVLLSPGCGDPLYRKALRTSSGAALMVPFGPAEPWPEALAQLQAAGFLVAAMTPAADAIEIGDFASTGAARGRIALLFGTEGAGLSADALSVADVRLRIPIRPAVDSLNVATAAGITLHRVDEARRSRREMTPLRGLSRPSS